MTDDILAAQQWVQSALVKPPSGDRLRAEELLLPNTRMSPAQRLAIYQRGYYARLVECMAKQFRALKHALGTELFRDFACLYLEAQPSRSHSLADLGAGFPAYLEATRPDCDSAQPEPWIDFMIDLARFEWDLAGLFDQPGHEGLPYATATDPDDSLRLQPCFAIGRYRYPVGNYYRLVAQGQDPGHSPELPTWIAFVRRDYVVGIHHLTAEQFTLLQCMVEQGVPQAIDQNQRKTKWEEWKISWLAAGFFIR